MTQGTQRSSKGLIATLVAIGLVIAAVSAIKQDPDRRPGRIPADDDLTEEIVISVTFKPNIRIDDPVHVLVHVDDTMVENALVTHSPYNAIIAVPKGAQVSAFALQDIDGELDCLITKQAVTVYHQHRDSAGSVICWMNRKS